MNNGKYIRGLLAFVIVAMLGYALHRGTIPGCAELSRSLESFGIWAPILFIIIYILATIFFVPGTVLTLVGGVFFGPWLGTIYVSLGALIGAQLAFVLSRTLLRNLAEKYLEGQSWYHKLKLNFIEYRFSYLLFLRLSPVFPFNGLNYACGLLPIEGREYFLASLIGMLPGTLAYVYAANAVGCAALDKGDFFSPELRTRLLLSLTALSLLSLLPVLIKRFRK